MVEIIRLQATHRQIRTRFFRNRRSQHAGIDQGLDIIVPIIMELVQGLIVIIAQFRIGIRVGFVVVGFFRLTARHRDRIVRQVAAVFRGGMFQWVRCRFRARFRFIEFGMLLMGFVFLIADIG